MPSNHFHQRSCLLGHRVSRVTACGDFERRACQPDRVTERGESRTYRAEGGADRSDKDTGVRRTCVRVEGKKERECVRVSVRVSERVSLSLCVCVCLRLRPCA